MAVNQLGVKCVKWSLLLLLLSASLCSWSNENDAKSKEIIPALVLDLELLGDTSIESLKAQDARFLKKFSQFFRQQLKQQNAFNVIDDAQSLALLEDAAAHQYLHRCNGCELDLARKMGAKVVVVPWVFRMSVLLQVLNIEIREVETGRLIMKRPYDFRGNTETAWEKTIRYTLNDIKGAAANYRIPLR